jgi:uncharacterized protein YbjQ (UPF0145 family)
MDIVAQYLEVIIFLALTTLGYVAGSMAEKKHYQSIKVREEELLHMAVTTEEDFLPEQIREAVLVTGSAVISIDYFKRLVATLRSIFGGRVKSYESLVDRARREAILRMKESARTLGAEMVINMRMDTTAIGGKTNNKQIGCVEAIAPAPPSLRESSEVHPQITARKRQYLHHPSPG